MKELHFYNQYHLGDQLMHIHFMNKLLSKNQDFKIYNYMSDAYIKEADLHRHPDFINKITNLSLKERKDGAENSWINRDRFHDKWIAGAGTHGFVDFDIFYSDFYNYLFDQIGIDGMSFTPEDSIIDHPAIMNGSENKHFDFLIINSDTKSGQWFSNPGEWDTLINYLKGKGYKIVTTQKSKFNSVPSTLEDFNMNLLQLGRLAANCRFVVGNHTAPWLFALNKKSIEKIEFLICMQNKGLSYSYDKVYPVRHSIDEVYTILNNEGL